MAFAMEMLELLQGLFDIAFHGHFNPPFGIIKLEVDANVLCCIPVHLERVFFADTSNEVVCISFGGVPDGKIIHHEGESCRACFVCE